MIVSMTVTVTLIATAIAILTLTVLAAAIEALEATEGYQTSPAVNTGAPEVGVGIRASYRSGD